MTLGNSPQPLTRRQLRELARENEPVSAENRSNDESPASPEPRPSSSPAPVEADEHHSRHTAPPVERTEAERPAAVRPEPVRPEPVRPEPVRAERADSEPAGSEPAESKPADSDPAKSVPAKSVPVRSAPAPLPIPEPAVVHDTGRTLSRRELRALQAAASASTDGAADRPSADDHSAHNEAADERQSVPVPAKRDAAAPSAAPAPASGGLHPPIGHWSVDREDDSHIETIGRRDDQTFDDLVGRGVGAGGIPTTTNALILPSIPRQGPAGPITSTGEIMITGSIDLPRSLGATGQHPNLFDSSEMDRMLDQLDEGGHHNDVAPVSASRAVSTHTSTRGVMTPPRKRGASLPTVLAITAAVLAIGVLSLFVVGYAFNIY